MGSGFHSRYGHISMRMLMLTPLSRVDQRFEQTMLPAQLRLSQLPALPCFLQWINIKKLFEEHYGVRPDGMMDMLQHLRIKPQGRPHSGYVT